MEEEMKKKLEEAGMTDVIKAFEDNAAALEAEKQGREEDKKAHAEEIKKKDTLIEQKNQDLVGARKQYKKLEEMTQEEKDALSETELELKERQEKLEAEREAFEKSQKEFREKEVASRRNAAIKKIAGDDEELAKKIEDSLGEVKGADEAYTPEEIEAVVTKGFNMLGVPRPKPAENAINDFGGGDAGIQEEGGFADTEQGKALADSLGIAPPPQESK